jgi:predicted TIM-barrel fold metal-dependent hydrolase
MPNHRMRTRRDIMAGSVVAGALARARMALAKPSQPATAVNFDVPRNACDCHTHSIGDPASFPFWSGRSYTPEMASPEEMMAVHKALHIERVVIVTPSVYGTDNSATLHGIKRRGKNARGVAVIDEKTPDSVLDAMGQAGIRGIRLNLANAGQNDPETGRRRFRAAADRIKSRKWHIQMYTSLPVISGIKDLIRTSPVPVVFDHFAGADAARGVQQPGFADVLELVGSGKAYVKLSAPYHASTQAPDYRDVEPLAKALIAANVNRMLWGTDWPHTNSATPPGGKPTDVTPLFQIDDGRLLNQLAVWAPDPVVRKKILVDNPAGLYGF